MSDIIFILASRATRVYFKYKYLLLDFFFGFVALAPFVAVLDTLGAPFVALLGPLVDLDRFVADDLALFIAAGLALFALVLASCAACIAKSSCLLEHPVFSKIRLMVGEVSSSSTVARVALEALDVVALAVDGREAVVAMEDRGLQ